MLNKGQNLSYALAIAFFIGGNGAQGQTSDTATSARCATRLSIAILGQAASNSLLQSRSPQTEPETLAMFYNPLFIKRFSRYIDSKFNTDPGERSIEDSAYFLSKYVLKNNLSWQDVVVGKFALTGGIFCIHLESRNCDNSEVWRQSSYQHHRLKINKRA